MWSVTGKSGTVHSLSSSKVAATPILKSVQSQFSPVAEFSPKVTQKGKSKKKITAIYCLWMIDNERGKE